MYFPIRLFTIFSCRTHTLSLGEYVCLWVFGDWCLMASFNLDVAWASVIAFHAVNAVSGCSACVALGTLDSRNERGERNYSSTSADGTTLSGPSASLYASTAKLCKTSFFSLAWSIRSFRNVRLIGSWYLSHITSALWCYVPDPCNSTSWISQIFLQKYLWIENNHQEQMRLAIKCEQMHIM